MDNNENFCEIQIEKTPIIKMLSSYLDKESVSFHMPGHTNGKSFSSWLAKNALSIDTTELQFTDDLHSPNKAIKKSLILAANTFRSKYTFFVTTGSTTAIYATLLSATKPGDKIILFRNVHKSVLNACMMFNLNPVFAVPHNLHETIKQNQDAKLVFLTSPDYFGKCEDIRSISRIVHQYKMMLIVDEAHGTHFGFCPGILPESATILGGDIIIQSAHKTVPALTQASYIHISYDAVLNNRTSYDKLSEALTMITTSSPSFLIAATLDFARAYLEEFGMQASRLLNENINYFYSILNPAWLDCFENISRITRLPNSVDSEDHYNNDNNNNNNNNHNNNNNNHNHDNNNDNNTYYTNNNTTTTDTDTDTDTNSNTYTSSNECNYKNYGVITDTCANCTISDKSENIMYDPFRIVMNLENANFSTKQVVDVLTAKGIFIEFYDLTRIVIICKFENTKEDFEYFAKVLNEYLVEFNVSSDTNKFNIKQAKTLRNLYEKSKLSIPEQRFKPNCGLTHKDSYRIIPLNRSIGLVSFSALVPYPPGIPLIWPGEVIDEDMVNLIKGLLDYNISIYGVIEKIDPATNSPAFYIKCIV